MPHELEGRGMVASLQILRSYVPGLLAAHFLGRPMPLATAECHGFPASVVFADISGFTPLAERLALRGPSGIEELSGVLNRCFGRALSTIAAHRGEVISFAGDALLAVWPAVEEDLATATCRASRCALEVRSALTEDGALDGARLSLRIGVGAGEVTALQVGGAAGRWHLLVCGAPLRHVGEAEQRALPGEVVLSPEAWELAAPRCRGELRSGGFAHLVSVASSLIPPALPLARREVGEAVRAYVPTAVHAQVAAGHAEWSAELRRVTPLFVNLLDVDPAAPEVLEPVQTAIGAIQPILLRYEATLKEVVVDDKGLTVVAVFGLPPLAHEDDAARATGAALAIQEALREVGRRSAMGLASGRAFCGAVGSDIHREYAVVGDVMNVAARLMQAASGSILCDERTVHAARSRVTFQPLATMSVKGRTAPVAVYRPVAAIRQTTTSPRVMVGREGERERLLKRLRELERGTSGLVLIEGEPGIGKSRLLADLLEQAETHGVRTFSGEGDAIEKTSPYHAWRPIVMQLLDLVGVEDADARRARVLAHVGGDAELARLAPLLNHVLSLDLPDNELTRQLSGDVRADNTRELLVGLLEAGQRAPSASRRPLLVVLDDAHWLDSVSWALARTVVARVAPLLLVIAHRPLGESLPVDYRRLREAGTAEHVGLDRLAPHDALALVCDRLGVRRLPDRVATLIGERGQGNPFFSEELAYALRDRGVISVTDGVCTVTAGAGDLEAVSFPDTVHGVVAGRIDCLSPNLALTLKVASVVGRHFRFRVLRDVHPIGAQRRSVRKQLVGLQQQGFTVHAPEEPELAYLFKHAVTQEAAYDLLLHSHRRQLHRAVAEWHERHHADDLAPIAPLLAHHWDRAQEPAKTLPFLELAGDQALRGGAYEEAIGFLTSALSLANHVEPAPEDQRQARWHRQLGDAYMGLGRLPDSRLHAERAVALLGWPAPTTPLRLVRDVTGQLLEQAAHRTRGPRHRSHAGSSREAVLEGARAYERLTILNYFANARAASISAALHTINLAERVEGSPELARGYAMICVAAGVVGLHPLARRYGKWARQMARSADDVPALARVLMATTLYEISVANWHRSHEALSEGLELADRLGDQRSWGEFAFALAEVMYHQADFRRLAHWSVRMQARAMDAGDAQRAAHALMADVWACLPQGRFDDAVVRLREVIRLLEGRHAEADEIHAYGILALVLLRRQETQAARHAGEAAMRLIAHSQPTAIYILEGYAAVAEMYLTLWTLGDDAAARPARDACSALRRLARVFPIARPRALLCAGMAAHVTGAEHRAATAWRKSLATAERLAMPYDRARAHYEIARHLLRDDPVRLTQLTRACEIFADIGATYELTVAQTALSEGV